MKQEQKYKLNIQLFGDDGGALTFDEILSDPVYQSEFDKRVESAIQKRTAAITKERDTALKSVETMTSERDNAIGERDTLKSQLDESAKNYAWDLAVANLGTIDAVAFKAHTQEFVNQAEFKDGTIVGFDEHAQELLKDKLSYLLPKNKATGGFFETPPAGTLEEINEQIAKNMGLNKK